MHQSSYSWTFWSIGLLLNPPTTAFNAAFLARQFDDGTFDFSTITPTPELQYHPCYNNTFKCARLQVPLDWSKPNNTSLPGAYAAIGIITLPAKVPVTDPAYGGPILVDPGRPGGGG
ncbi:hypothetical protein C8A00DRAFT_37989 [Chaetomidium leptoderma]|uniref:Uncharacterized protein n=1 Tax=Chaetomidium leptoderma TaxID=669021 RepID=A0AAN6ZRR8_9PEZI|nr:hypothetical protein C8A00DRAFT_37989 [Chaetomidium leptoderma]